MYVFVRFKITLKVNYLWIPKNSVYCLHVAYDSVLYFARILRTEMLRRKVKSWEKTISSWSCKGSLSHWVNPQNLYPTRQRNSGLADSFSFYRSLNPQISQRNRYKQNDSLDFVFHFRDETPPDNVLIPCFMPLLKEDWKCGVNTLASHSLCCNLERKESQERPTDTFLPAGHTHTISAAGHDAVKDMISSLCHTAIRSQDL